MTRRSTIRDTLAATVAAVNVTAYKHGAIGARGLTHCKGADLRKSMDTWAHLTFMVEAQTTNADDREGVGSQWVTPFGISIAYQMRAGLQGGGQQDDLDLASDMAEDILTAILNAASIDARASVSPVSYVVGAPDEKGNATVQILVNVRHKFGA